MRVQVCRGDINAALVAILNSEQPYQEGLWQAYVKERDCPLARAIRRHTGCPATVFADAVLLVIGDEAPRILLPENARRAIACFDERRWMRPFAFDFEMPAGK